MISHSAANLRARRGGSLRFIGFIRSRESPSRRSRDPETPSRSAHSQPREASRALDNAKGFLRSGDSIFRQLSAVSHVIVHYGKLKGRPVERLVASLREPTAVRASLGPTIGSKGDDSGENPRLIGHPRASSCKSRLPKLSALSCRSKMESRAEGWIRPRTRSHEIITARGWPPGRVTLNYRTRNRADIALAPSLRV